MAAIGRYLKAKTRGQDATSGNELIKRASTRTYINRRRGLGFESCYDLVKDNIPVADNCLAVAKIIKFIRHFLNKHL